MVEEGEDRTGEVRDVEGVEEDTGEEGVEEKVGTGVLGRKVRVEVTVVGVSRTARAVVAVGVGVVSRFGFW